MTRTRQAEIGFLRALRRFACSPIPEEKWGLLVLLFIQLVTYSTFKFLLLLKWGICKFCTALGPGKKVLLGKKKQIGSSVKDKNRLKRVVKVCSRFYALISSLLMRAKIT